MKVEAMLWILVLVSVALAIASPKHRARSLMAGGIIIVAIVAIVVFTKRGDVPISTLPAVAAQATPQQPKHVDFERFHIENLDEKDPEARNRIAISEIRFEQIRPEVGSQPGTIGAIGARLYNDSARFALTDYAYYLVVQDCVKTTCTVVYDQRGWAPASVPANQARDITVAIRDGDTRGVPVFKVMGTANIKLSPTDTRSYQTVRAPGF
ncbi:MAG: hypothetical protein M3O26_13460 [Pseudomonadota bacterium]|nr:hypothetical protein [Pseudomonadota bacterium]